MVKIPLWRSKSEGNLSPSKDGKVEAGKMPSSPPPNPIRRKSSFHKFANAVGKFIVRSPSSKTAPRAQSPPTEPAAAERKAVSNANFGSTSPASPPIEDARPEGRSANDPVFGSDPVPETRDSENSENSEDYSHASYSPSNDDFCMLSSAAEPPISAPRLASPRVPSPVDFNLASRSPVPVAPVDGVQTVAFPAMLTRYHSEPNMRYYPHPMGTYYPPIPPPPHLFHPSSPTASHPFVAPLPHPPFPVQPMPLISRPELDVPRPPVYFSTEREELNLQYALQISVLETSAQSEQELVEEKALQEALKLSMESFADEQQKQQQQQQQVAKATSPPASSEEKPPAVATPSTSGTAPQLQQPSPVSSTPFIHTPKHLHRAYSTSVITKSEPSAKPSEEESGEVTKPRKWIIREPSYLLSGAMPVRPTQTLQQTRSLRVIPSIHTMVSPSKPLAQEAVSASCEVGKV